MAITLAAAGNGFDQWVCKNNHIVGSNAKKTPRKLNLCNNDIIKLIEHQEKLFKKYVELKNPSPPERWFLWHTQVWWLQNLMSQADISCHTNKDCKLWVNTASDFLFCQVCSSINTDWKELKSLTPGDNCETWYVLTDDKLCCQKAPTDCKIPTFKWSVWDLSWGNKLTYSWEETITLEVDYSINSFSWLRYDDDYSIDWVQIVAWPLFNNKKITLSAKADLNSNIINIKIPDWSVKLWEYACPGVSIKLEREIVCQLTKDRAQCTNKGDFNISNDNLFTWFASLLDKKCEKPWMWKIPFCPDKCTNRKFDNFTCEQTYGSWRYWTSQTPTCCKNCWPNRILVDDECECDTTKPCNRSWDKRNLNTCKCECDPSQRCCWILLNTVVPFIWDCIEMTSQNDVWSSNNDNTSTVNQLNAFPFLMMWLSKILVTAILIFSFLIVIVSWLMMVTWVYDEGNYKKWMERIKKVVVALILLWSSWLILKLINPSFFWG